MPHNSAKHFVLCRKNQMQNQFDIYSANISSWPFEQRKNVQKNIAYKGKERMTFYEEKGI